MSKLLRRGSAVEQEMTTRVLDERDEMPVTALPLQQAEIVVGGVRGYRRPAGAKHSHLCVEVRLCRWLRLCSCSDVQVGIYFGGTLLSPPMRTVPALIESSHVVFPLQKMQFQVMQVRVDCL